jgi:CheY-like chemotaxis protein
MPVMDGFEATRRIRALYKHKNFFPFILGVSADTSSEIQSVSFNSGMTKILPKPLDEQLLSQFFAEAQGIVIGELQKMRDFIGASTVHQMIAIFVEELDARLLAFSQWISPAEDMDFKSIETSAHRLRSSCLAIKAQRAVQLCSALEESAKKIDKDETRRVFGRLVWEFQQIRLQTQTMSLDFAPAAERR